MSIELPPPPATVEEALTQANQIAYGFAKHTDPAYWKQGVGYQGDPNYFWKRLLGWQAGPEDRAQYGVYAVPPSPWNIGTPVPVEPPPPIDPPPPPQSDTPLMLVLARLNQIDARLTQLEARLTGLEAHAVQFGTQVLALKAPSFPVYSGSIFGVKITLTPK